MDGPDVSNDGEAAISSDVDLFWISVVREEYAPSRQTTNKGDNCEVRRCSRVSVRQQTADTAREYLAATPQMTTTSLRMANCAVFSS